ncbi:hypothetical protein BpHYR1_007551 [Brachionus plicatilis]|uniref:Uncharacterized protein n=1 Tax=Brachionus plicatilis TaxID=10195 RepID=A0A3M7S209_BRAPC|nr:hypothetical protein BpHYR1_007551 [Brachionus plicatilis]
MVLRVLRDKFFFEFNLVNIKIISQFDSFYKFYYPNNLFNYTLIIRFKLKIHMCLFYKWRNNHKLNLI